MEYKPPVIKFLPIQEKIISFDFSNMYPTVVFGSRRSAQMTNYETWNIFDEKKYKKEIKDQKITNKINKYYGMVNNHKCSVVNGCIEIDDKRFFMMKDELYFVMNLLNKSKIKSHFIANYSAISRNENIKEVFDYLMS